MDALTNSMGDFGDASGDRPRWGLSLEGLHGGNVEVLAPRYGYKIEDSIDFSANLNPFGPPPGTFSLLHSALKEISHYPDPQYGELKSVLSQWEGVNVEELVVGNGGSELIYAVAQEYGKLKALIIAPTFTEYEKSVVSAGGEAQFWFAKEEESFQFPFKEDSKEPWDVDLVFLSNPNNPTGNLYPKALLEGWIRSRLKINPKTVFICDESFLWVVPNGKTYSLNSFASKTEGVIVLHSLTKLFSVPGLRLGVAVGHPSTLKQLENRLPTWRVNGLAQKFGESILNYSDFVKDSVDTISKIKREFMDELERIPEFKIFPSGANFLLIKLSQRIDGPALKEYCAKKGLFIRDCNDFRGLEKDRFIRIAVRKESENLLLMDTMAEFLAHAR